MGWTALELAPWTDRFRLDNVISETKATGTRFVVFGTRPDNKGVIYYVDFGTMGLPTCRDAASAGSVGSDYYLWAPSDGAAAAVDCHMGKKQSYTRRKPTAECINGEEFERPSAVSNCACAQSDYTCAFGFTRPADAIGDGRLTCQPVEIAEESSEAALIPAACSWGAASYKTIAYRKIVGNACSNGWSPMTEDFPCPAGLHGNHGWYYLRWFCIFLSFGIAFQYREKLTVQIKQFSTNIGPGGASLYHGLQQSGLNSLDDAGVDVALDSFAAEPTPHIHDFLASNDFENDAPALIETMQTTIKGKADAFRAAVPSLAPPRRGGGGIQAPPSYNSGGGDDCIL